MIRIAKSLSPPRSLVSKKASETMKKLEEQFHKTGAVKVPNKHYNSKTVKQKLKQDQHDKCCYCEGKFSAFSSGDVEHFRPKNGYFISKTNSLVKPGYFWLAFKWENLYFSCGVCNSSYKRNHFPLTHESKRTKPTSRTLELISECLLIDPGKEDPSIHIEFNKEIPVGKTTKGIESIKLVGLDRMSLNDERRKALKNFQFSRSISSLDISRLSPESVAEMIILLRLSSQMELEDFIEDAKTEVAFSLSPTGEFSHMLVCNS